MWIWVKRPTAFVARNGNSIIAVSSVLIACLSLYFTIQAQNDDRAYKELLIKPSLSRQAHSVDFSVVIANVGLGPAQIKDILYQFGGECISMVDANGELSRASYDKVIDGLNTRFLNDIFSFGIPNTAPTAITTRNHVLFPEEIIGVGKEVVLFRVDDSSLEMFRTKMKALDVKLTQSLIDQFTARALTLPISIKYCSMSGKYCEINEPEGETGKRCRFK